MCWQVDKQVILVMGKLVLMHVRKVPSQISMCGPDRLIREDMFRFYLVSVQSLLNKNLVKAELSALRPVYPEQDLNTSDSTPT
jgi:hypothetical protein